MLDSIILLAVSGLFIGFVVRIKSVEHEQTLIKVWKCSLSSCSNRGNFKGCSSFTIKSEVTSRGSVTTCCWLLIKSARYFLHLRVLRNKKEKKEPGGKQNEVNLLCAHFLPRAVWFSQINVEIRVCVCLCRSHTHTGRLSEDQTYHSICLWEVGNTSSWALVLRSRKP